jgi:hypothetical protein
MTSAGLMRRLRSTAIPRRALRSDIDAEDMRALRDETIAAAA